MKVATLTAAVAVLLAGCTPKLLRHYEAFQPSGAPPKVELSVFLANPKSSDATMVISGLDGRAQAELIRSLAAKMPADSKPADLVALLLKNPEPPSKPCIWASNKSATKRLVLTVLGDLRRPADRLDKLDISFTLSQADGSDARASFVSWDHFDTVYGKYDIGTAKYTQSGKLSVGRTGTDVANLPVAAGSATKVLTLGAEATNALEESATYALRRMSIGGALTKESARLVQEGGPNVNLFGSSVATLTLSLETSPYPMYSLVLLKDKKPLPPSDVTVERCEGEYPVSASPITVDVTAKAFQRAVTQGDGTVGEGDDAITLSEVPLSPITANVTLLKDTDLRLERYALAFCTRAQSLGDCVRLHIEHNGISDGNIEQLVLPSRDAAVALRGWLVEQTKGSTLAQVNGLAIGMARKEAATTHPVPTLRGVSTSVARELRVVRIPDSE